MIYWDDFDRIILIIQQGRENWNLMENTAVEIYINLGNYCNIVEKSQMLANTGCLKVFYSWCVMEGLKNCLNILKWPIVSLKLVRNCAIFRMAQKKLIFFKLEVLALILKIYFKIFNGRNYCYNRSGNCRTVELFKYFKIP